MSSEKISFAAAVGIALKKYVNFRGVATRREYWFFILFITLLSLVTGQLDQILFPDLTQKATDTANALLSSLENSAATPDWQLFRQAITAGIDSTPISNFFGVATLLPLVTVTVRRMRDAGFAGWWLLLIWLQLFTFVITLLPSKRKSL